MWWIRERAFVAENAGRSQYRLCAMYSTPTSYKRPRDAGYDECYITQVLTPTTRRVGA